MVLTDSVQWICICLQARAPKEEPLRLQHWQWTTDAPAKIECGCRGMSSRDDKHRRHELRVAFVDTNSLCTCACCIAGFGSYSEPRFRPTGPQVHEKRDPSSDLST